MLLWPRCDAVCPLETRVEGPCRRFRTCCWVGKQRRRRRRERSLTHTNERTHTRWMHACARSRTTHARGHSHRTKKSSQLMMMRISISIVNIIVTIVAAGTSPSPLSALYRKSFSITYFKTGNSFGQRTRMDGSLKRKRIRALFFSLHASRRFVFFVDQSASVAVLRSFRSSNN